MNGLVWPQCGAVRTVKNGYAPTGKQRTIRRVCGHQFTLQSVWHRVSVETIALVNRLLMAQIFHRGICRVIRISRSWFRLHLEGLSRRVPHDFRDPLPQ
ncbi:hypothetical protein [Deinococcus humi]|uniref:Transposase-like protein n=1 Tax=Deinococcus humi TaxID=662880 RepID=A0A7W8NIR2_9DEIO|nr:hypothetical protein [Deinococcus humi]MBB5366103.1 transposase-like protein [Deinococcus humi]